MAYQPLYLYADLHYNPASLKEIEECESTDFDVEIIDYLVDCKDVVDEYI